MARTFGWGEVCVRTQRGRHDKVEKPLGQGGFFEKFDLNNRGRGTFSLGENEGLPQQGRAEHPHWDHGGKS
jgi:hypothetical protein